MILGEQVRLRSIEPTDLPLLVSWMNDPEVTAGLMLWLPLSTREEESWYENMLRRPPEERALAIEANIEGQWRHIGNCGFHEIDWRVRACTVGIVIGEKQFWNQGYGTKAMQLLLKHGFETLNMTRIALDVYDNNPRAIRSYEKCGFVLEGRKRQAMYKNGEYLDVLIMSVLRHEWKR